MLVPTMMKPPPVVAAEPVVAGDVPVVLRPLATIRPPPDVAVVRDDEAEAVKGWEAAAVVEATEPPDAITPAVMMDEMAPVQTAPLGQQATWPA